MSNKNYAEMSEQELQNASHELDKKISITNKLLIKATAKKEKLKIEHQLANSYYQTLAGKWNDDEKSALRKLKRLGTTLRESVFQVAELTKSIQEMQESIKEISDRLYDDWVDDPDHEINVFIDDDE